MQHPIRLALTGLLFIFTACTWGCDSSGNGGPSAEDIALEAQRVKSVGKLIDASARNPEYMPELKAQHEAFSHFDGHYLLEPHTPLLEARILTVAKYIEGSARQPEMEPKLKDLFDSYAGLLTPELIKNSERAHCFRMLTLGKLLESVARQPEKAPSLKEKAASYLGRFDDYPLHTMATPLVLYYRNIALEKLIEGIARQPESAPLLRETAAAFLGQFSDYPIEAMTNPRVLAGRVQLVGQYIEGVTRQPEEETLLEEVLTVFAGDKSLVVNSTSCLVNAARLDALSDLSESSGRQPYYFFDTANCTGENCKKFQNILEQQAGPIQLGSSSSGCSLPESLWLMYD
ncbi:hypothetical protein DSLASN_22420 [Desulfoluna limicola]|uniref:Lipoprotein n=1 Tax=Desulfoluna limicola TaxID=2810562 RepID=A0ABM7PGB2_9BACT|nr:hypothetical protein [Desulfoluna limicola]BCS96610.1 hypothetical protein DSLASN_22420 [Desulfoluna limicola]